jgi:hypothetical protein
VDSTSSRLVVARSAFGSGWQMKPFGRDLGLKMLLLERVSIACPS